MAIFVAIDGPPDQLWLPQMVHLTLSGPPVFFNPLQIMLTVTGS